MGKVVPLTTQTAKITTAAVEIKTLTVSGKQVTLAVFRQLIEEDLVSREGTLNGLPWGTVNYHPGTCTFRGRELKEPHWHVVWQSGAELRRSTVPMEVSKHFHSKAGDTYAGACLRDVVLGDMNEEDCLWSIDVGEATVRGAAEGLSFCFSTSHAIISRLRSLVHDLNEIRQGRLNECYRRDWEEAVQEICARWPEDRDALERQWLKEIRAESVRRAQWEKTLQEIAALPQLFIAV